MSRTPIVLLSLWILLSSSRGSPAFVDLTLFPNHFQLHPGEQIQYNVCPTKAVEEYLKGKLSRNEFQCVDAKFTTEDPGILRVTSVTTIKNGESATADGVLEAVRSGRTHLVVRTANTEERFTITVAGPTQPPIQAVPYTAVKEIQAKEFLFVGHANRDGYDRTAVAKAGIDRAVARARKRGVPVVYWVSNTYPNWYTADRRPDYAFVSEGQEHEIHVDAERVTFTGGSFILCVLRNAQMTLHGMLKHDARHVEFMFPADAIWVEDADKGDHRWYPEPEVLLSTLFARRAKDTKKFEDVVVPFLDSVINEFPIAGYPRIAPTPPLRNLLQDWKIVVRFGDRFERVYREGKTDKVLLVTFQGM